jgi:hypothetical protein
VDEVQSEDVADVDPGEDQVEQVGSVEPEPPGPLLRDPPPPPGYTNPVEQSDLLDSPFASEREP